MNTTYVSLPPACFLSNVRQISQTLPFAVFITTTFPQPNFDGMLKSHYILNSQNIPKYDIDRWLFDRENVYVVCKREMKRERDNL